MKNALRAAIFLLVPCGPAWALDPFVVRDIRVEGIQRIEAGTVFNYLPVKVGDTMTDEKAAGAIRTLFATGFFRDVRLEAQGNVLIVTLEERPAIASIEFTGMKEFEKDKVKQGLRDVGFQEGRIFDRALLDQAEQELKRQYLTRGLFVGHRVADLDGKVIEDGSRLDALDAFDADVPHDERIERPRRPGEHEQEDRGSQRVFH